jgi:hypothetical protein
MTRIESVISLALNPGWPAKQWADRPHLGSVGPGLFAMSSPRVILSETPLVFDIMKICMDFGPYDAFLSSNIPEMVDQQNSRKSLVIGTYLLYHA